MKIKLKIPGYVQPKERPRATRTGIVYTPRKTADYEKTIQALYRKEHGDMMMPAAPIRVYVKVYMAIPKSASRQDKEDMRLGLILPTKRPDIDNLAKGILDALNGIAYPDDKYIAELTVAKFYDDGNGERAEVILCDE